MILIQFLRKLSSRFISSLSSFWKAVTKWAKKVCKNIKEGGFHYFLKFSNSIYGTIKSYKKLDENKWEEKTVQRTITENEVPADILAMVKTRKGQNVDMTNKMKQALSA